MAAPRTPSRVRYGAAILLGICSVSGKPNFPLGCLLNISEIWVLFITTGPNNAPTRRNDTGRLPRSYNRCCS